MFDRFKLAHRIWAAVIVFALVLVAVMINAFAGLKAARDALEHVHTERMDTAVALAQMRRGYLINRMEILLIFQHAPDSPTAGLHDHPITMHTDNIAKLKADNDAAQQRVYGRPHIEPEEQALLEELSAKRKAWQAKRDAVMQALQRGDFSPQVMSEFLAAGRQEGAAYEAIIS